MFYYISWSYFVSSNKTRIRTKNLEAESKKKNEVIDEKSLWDLSQFFIFPFILFDNKRKKHFVERQGKQLRRLHLDNATRRHYRL